MDAHLVKTPCHEPVEGVEADDDAEDDGNACPGVLVNAAVEALLNLVVALFRNVTRF